MSDGSILAVGIILYPGFDTLDVMGPIELLSVPTVKDKFRLVLMSLDGQPVTSAAGVRVVPDHCSAHHPALDVLLVPGNLSHLFKPQLYCKASPHHHRLVYYPARFTLSW